MRTPRGRKATQKTFSYFDKTLGSTQGGLF